MEIENASEQIYFNTRLNKQHKKQIFKIAANLYEKGFQEGFKGWKKQIQ